MSLDDDLALILATGEDTFTAGGVSVPCDLYAADDLQGQSEQSAGILIGQSWVMVQASKFPSLKTDDACTINETNFEVASVRRIQDGKVLLVVLGDVDQDVRLGS